MKKLALIFTLLFASSLSAQMLLPPAPTWEEKDGQKALFDFGVPLEGISDENLDFNSFQSQATLIFYFSAKCPHCMRAYPKLNVVFSPFLEKGLKVVAIASSMNSKPDIRTFMENQKVEVPMFKDKARVVSKKYGVGTVPLVILVNQKGEFIRYRNVDSELNDIQIELEKLFPEP